MKTLTPAPLFLTTAAESSDFLPKLGGGGGPAVVGAAGRAPGEEADRPVTIIAQGFLSFLQRGDNGVWEAENAGLVANNCAT